MIDVISEPALLGEGMRQAGGMLVGSAVAVLAAPLQW
jgi:hypothetical protein